MRKTKAITEKSIRNRLRSHLLKNAKGHKISKEAFEATLDRMVLAVTIAGPFMMELGRLMADAVEKIDQCGAAISDAIARAAIGGLEAGEALATGKRQGKS